MRPPRNGRSRVATTAFAVCYIACRVLINEVIVNVGTIGTFPVPRCRVAENWTDFFRRTTCFTRLQFVLWILGLTVPSIPPSRLANLDGAFEYGAEREYASQFMCSK